MVMQEAARYGCLPKLIFSPNRKANDSAFFGKPTWSPKMKTEFSGKVVSAAFLPSSSSTKRLCVLVFSLIRASKLVLSVVIPGCDLPAMTFRRMVVHVFTSVRTS